MQKIYKKYFAIFTLPTLIAYAIAFVVPFFMGLYLSFCKFKTIGNAKWVGLSNYLYVFQDSNGFLAALWFTVKIAVVGVITTNVIAFALALLLTRGLKGTNAFRTVFFMPNLIGGIILGYIWQLLLNGILIKLMEAAQIDGANYRQTLRKIIIPLVMPSITICSFLSLTDCFKMYDQNLALTGGAPGTQTAMLAMDICNTYYNRIGFAGIGQAKAVVFTVLVFAIAMVQLRATRSKEVE